MDMQDETKIEQPDVNTTCIINKNSTTGNSDINEELNTTCKNKKHSPLAHSLNRLTRCGLLTTVGLTLFMIEARLPAPLPIAGAKIGLSNAVTLMGVYRLGWKAGASILVGRIILGGIFSGQWLTLCYSLAGGISVLLFLGVVQSFTTEKQLWLVSPLCGVCHNLGQLWVASRIMGTGAVLYFLPYLIFLGIISGLLVGIATQETLRRLEGKL